MFSPSAAMPAQKSIRIDGFFAIAPAGCGFFFSALPGQKSVCMSYNMHTSYPTEYKTTFKVIKND